MNVKANMAVAELPEVHDLFIMPSSGDESICVGAAYQAYADQCQAAGVPVEVTEFGAAYLGPGFGPEQVEACLTAAGAFERYHVRRQDEPNQLAADLLAEGKILARFEAAPGHDRGRAGEPLAGVSALACRDFELLEGRLRARRCLSV